MRNESIQPQIHHLIRIRRGRGRRRGIVLPSSIPLHHMKPPKATPPIALWGAVRVRRGDAPLRRASLGRRLRGDLHLGLHVLLLERRRVESGVLVGEWGPWGARVEVLWRVPCVKMRCECDLLVWGVYGARRRGHRGGHTTHRRWMLVSECRRRQDRGFGGTLARGPHPFRAPKPKILPLPFSFSFSAVVIRPWGPLRMRMMGRRPASPRG